MTVMSLVLTDLKIWDGAEVLAADTLQVEDQKISWIGHKEDLDPSLSKTAQSHAGLTAMPGLIDAHVHLELNPDDSKPPEKSLPTVIPLMRERAHQMVKAGITTARDLGGGAWFELALRDQILAGEFPGPRLICSGQPITCPQGHCHFWGGEASSLAEATDVLHRQVAQNVDLIKIMATGGRLTAGSQPTDAQFPQATLDALVATAHQHKLPVAAHCHGTEGIHRAALAGVDTIEHCSWVGNDGWASDYQPDVAQVILENGIWVSPTVNKGWQRMLDSKTGAVLQRVRAAYRKMIDLGIPMLASTDAGIPGVYHHELPAALVVFAQIAQLSPTQALQSATSAAARALGVSHLVGSLAPGMDADILLVEGDPTVDLVRITQPASVYARGVQYL
ncbi:MAG: imidazolonepropionase-like amidohydrolase [Limisphaerales bacterium]|jgi:imidazolonepropionase-like amidohydrolase